MRPAPALSAQECSEVKTVAQGLLAKLESVLVPGWRQKAAARSQIRPASENTLDTGLPQACTPEIFTQECPALFEHVRER